MAAEEITSYDKLCETLDVMKQPHNYYYTGAVWLYPPFDEKKQIALIKMINGADFIDYIAICQKADGSYTVQAVCITEFASEKPKLYTEVQPDFSEAIAGLTLQLLKAGELDKEEVRRVFD